MKIKKLNCYALTPTYATDGSGCFDLYATEEVTVCGKEGATISTGISFEVPEGYVMLIFSRSGHGFNKGVRLGNCVGVIDSDYRGEVLVRLHNDSNKHFFVKFGDRIAQGLLVQSPKVEFEVVEELSNTERGEGGFGSTN